MDCNKTLADRPDRDRTLGIACGRVHILPDLLKLDLDIVFCGTAAGSESARRGAYYAGPGNAFWPTLHRVGLTPHVLDAADFRQLIRWNMGFTDLAKTTSGSDQALTQAHFDADRLRSVVLAHRPKILAFTGKRAATEFLDRSVDYGLMSAAFESTRLFVLPSPSGAARRFWDQGPWRELADFRAELTATHGDAGRASSATSTIATLTPRP